MDRAGLITLEQARAAGLSFDEPEPRACLDRLHYAGQFHEGCRLA